MLKRLFPSRWARIVAWTGAAIAWGTSIVAVQAQVQESATTTTVPEARPEPNPEVQEVPELVAAVPAAPEQGGVVIRYTPVPPPPPEVLPPPPEAPPLRFDERPPDWLLPDCWPLSSSS